MNKTIEFELNKFKSTPQQLRVSTNVNLPGTSFVVDLARLYHHYYTDSYDVNPPSPDHTNFEYLNFISSSQDFRFLNNGPGASTGKKRTISTDFGQAFCRYFLYEFCNITYFAHMDKVLDKSAHPAFNGVTVKRLSAGDAPDYLCSISPSEPFIGEAKGRFSNISFSSSQFDDWRNQFNRIADYDKDGNQKKLKGYIIATRFATEKNKISYKSKVFAEDPETPGQGFLDSNTIGLGRGSIAIHYARLLSKLGLNLLGSCLSEGFVVPEQLSFNLPVWRCNYQPLKGELFVGGYYSKIEPLLSKTKNETYIFHPNILKLGNPNPVFFGLNFKVMQALRRCCLGDWDALNQLPSLEDTDYRPSNLAWLRDGSISGSLDFFEFTGIQTI